MDVLGVKVLLNIQEAEFQRISLKLRHQILWCNSHDRVDDPLSFRLVFMKSKSLDKDELHSSLSKAVHVASGARLLTEVWQQLRVRSDLQVASGARLIERCPLLLQSRVRNNAHVASGTRLSTEVR